MRRLQNAGNFPLPLVGGATGLIGDPNPGTERTLNAPDVVASWVDLIKEQIGPLLDFDGPFAARMVNNLDWTASLPAIDFLRDIGKHFSVNMMVAKESVRARMEDRDAGISYTEFSYMLLQAFDFFIYRRNELLRAADRRQRPMGQHHRRQRSDPPCRGRVGASAGYTADHRLGG